MKKEKDYEVTIFVDDMEYPEVATLTIRATSPKEARQWVLDNMRVSAEQIS